jgi:hypothetical protein
MLNIQRSGEFNFNIGYWLLDIRYFQTPDLYSVAQAITNNLEKSDRFARLIRQ